MKVVFFSFSLIIYMAAQGQVITMKEAEAYANKLVEKQILLQKGKESLMKMVATKKVEVEHPSTVNPITYTEDDLSKETILQYCAMAFKSSQTHRLLKNTGVEQKVKPEDSLVITHWQFSLNTSLGGLPDGKDADFIHPQRSTIGYTRTRTLNDFSEIGLISDMVYNDCKRALQNEEVYDEVGLLQFMVERSVYYSYYEFNKKEQEEYISKLVKKGILTEEERKTLLASYGDYELKTIPQILSYCDRYQLVDLRKVEANPKVIYPLIFENVKKLLPNFHYTDLQVSILEENESDLIRQDVMLSFQVDSNQYTQTFFQDYRKQKPDSLDIKDTSKLGEDFHKCINKWLADVESPFRLYRVNIPDKYEGPYGNSKVGLLLLKQGEAEGITQDPYIISRESFDNRLSKRNIDKLITEFTEQGFFTHLTKQEIDSAKQKVASSDIGSIEDVLLRFPKTIVLFDWETGNLENPYEELTKEFAEAARGSFTISNIVDEYKWEKAKRVKYGFTMNGKRYEALLPFNSDWLEPKFMEMIKKALKENKVDGDLYWCVDNGQEGGYIFLTTKQHRFIQDKYPDLLKE